MLVFVCCERFFCSYFPLRGYARHVAARVSALFGWNWNCFNLKSTWWEFVWNKLEIKFVLLYANSDPKGIYSLKKVVCTEGSQANKNESVYSLQQQEVVHFSQF